MNILTIKLSEFVPVNSKGNRIVNWHTFANQKNAFWEKIFSKESINIDLNGIHFLSPDGLIWLYHAFTSRNTRKFPRNFITLPDDSENVVRALKTLQLSRSEGILNLSITNLLRYQFANPFSKDESPLSRLVYVENSEKPSAIAITNEIVEAVQSYLYSELGAKSTDDTAAIISTFIRTLSEVVSNIRQHGAYDGKSQGFVCVVKPQKDFNVMRYAFFDAGEGFLKTIANKSREDRQKLAINQVASEADAIFSALIYRLVCPAKKVIGLYNTLDFIHQRQGKIEIFSKGIHVQIDLGRIRGNPFHREASSTEILKLIRSIAKIDSAYNIPGTSIMIELQMPKGRGNVRGRPFNRNY